MRIRVLTFAHVAEAGLGIREDRGFGRSVPTGGSTLREEYTTASTRIAVLVPAHNEEEVIDRSLAWAIRDTGRENVYLVADGCTDETVRFASYWIGEEHIYETDRMGRGPALLEAMRHFGLLDRYDGIFMADADSLIMPGSMEQYRASLESDVGAVIGHMLVLEEQSNLYACWRRYQYFWGFNLIVRAASVYRGCFQNTPGCCTVYSSAALKRIEHDPYNPAEDMDFCYQIHRKSLGRIVWNPNAWVQTADPLTLADYRRQVIRWGRGWWYNIRKHRMGLRFKAVDLLVGYVTLTQTANWLRAIVVAVLGLWWLGGGGATWLLKALAASYLLDFSVIGAISVVAAVRRKWDVVKWLPLYPVMVFVDLAFYGYAFLTQRRGLSAVWTSPVRERR